MKKRLLAFILTLSMMLSVMPSVAFAVSEDGWDNHAAEGFANGSGTEEDPYEIASEAELAFLMIALDGSDCRTYYQAYYELTKDLDLSDYYWQPNQINYGFAGNFEGNGNTITGLTMSSDFADIAEQQYTGLFGYVGAATITNLNLSNVSIAMSNTANEYVGALFGFTSYYNLFVQNVSVLSGSVQGGNYVGGLVGSSYGTFIGVSNSATVTNTNVGITDTYDARSYTGGLAGNFASETIVLNAENTGDVTSTSTDETLRVFAGGISGQSYGSIDNATNRGNVTVTSAYQYYAGGISGYASKVNNVINSGNLYITSTIDSSNEYMYAGGIAGMVVDYIYNSSNAGSVTLALGTDALNYIFGNSSTAGLAGSAPSVINCYNTGNIICTESSKGNMAGLVGKLTYDDMYNCYNSGSVSTNAALAYDNYVTIENSYWNDSSKSATYDDEYTNSQTEYCGTYSADNKTITAVNGSSIINGETTLIGALNAWVDENIAEYPSLIGWTGDDFAPTHLGNADVTGTISDNSNVISGATVSLVSSDGSTVLYSETSASNGIYSMSNVAPGTYIFQVSADGKLTSSCTLNVAGVDAIQNMKLLTPTAFGNNTISSADELAYVAQQVNSETYNYAGETLILDADINLDGYYWTPIGDDDYPFEGSLNGNNKTISNLTINSNAFYAGLFGAFSDGDYYSETSIQMEIYDLTLKDVNINSTGNVTGALVGFSEAHVALSNITVDGGVVNGAQVRPNYYDYGTGGIAGFFKCGYIENSSNSATVTGLKIGGIVGDAESPYDTVDYISSIRNCINTGEINSGYCVTGDEAISGGIVGDSSIDIQNCVNTADVTGYYAGGIASNIYGNITSCENSGDVYGASAYGYAGGIVATASFGYLLNNVNTGSVESNRYAGGIFGYSSSSALYVYNNYNTGDVSVYNCSFNFGVGGIGGYAGTSVYVANNYTLGEVDGSLDPEYDHYTAYIGEVIGFPNALSPIGVNYYLDNTLYPATGDIGVNFEQVQITDKDALLTALNQYIEDNKATITGLSPWVIDGTNDGYPVYAPAVDVTGSVKYNETPIENATVTLRDLTSNVALFETTTDGNGEFLISKVDADSYVLQIEAEGYLTTRVSADISTDFNQDIKLLSTQIAMTSNTITTADQLAYFASQVNSGITYEGQTITLGANVDLSGYYFLPIGNEINPFKGEFNGNGNTISNLTINTRDSYQGLFGATSYVDVNWGPYTQYAYIHDLTLSDVNITAGDYSGALVGVATGIVAEDVTVTGSITASNYASGLIGTAGDLIVDGETEYAKLFELDGITMNATVEATGTSSNAGGIVSYLYSLKCNAYINNSTVSGSIKATNYAGGFVGYGAYYTQMNATNVTNYATVEATGISSNAGGFAGYINGSNYASSPSVWNNVRNEGTITASNNAGGIAGYADQHIKLYNCENIGEITGNYAGGILGEACGGNSSNSEIFAVINSVNRGAVNGSIYAGGIIALGYDRIVLTNNFNVGTLSTSDVNIYAVSYDGITNTATDPTNYYLSSAANEQKTNDGDTAIIDAVTLKGLLNTWVNANISTYPDLVTWADNADTYGYPVFAIPAEITYDANGGTGTAPVESTTYYTGQDYVLQSGATLSKTGAEFAGWATSANGETIYKAGETYNLTTANVTFYAQWKTGIDNATIEITDLTFTGDEQTVSASVSVDGKTLTQGTDYEITEDGKVTNAGDYTFKISGLGLYTGTATKDFAVSPMSIEIDSTDYVLSKVYDGTTDKVDDFTTSIKTEVEDVTVEVTAVSDFANKYVTDENNVTLTLGDIKVTGELIATNYVIVDSKDVEITEYILTTGEITPFIIAEVSNEDIVISKTYDGTKDFNGSASGKLILKDENGTIAPDQTSEYLILNFTVGSFDSASVGNDKVVALTITSLTSDDNYALKDGIEGSTSNVTNASIIAAGYTVVVPTQVQIKVGSGLDVLTSTVSATVTGANQDSTPEGTLSFDTTDAALKALIVGETLVVDYTFILNSAIVNDNYDSTPKTGSITVGIVEGDPQNLTWKEISGTLNATYGDTIATDTTASTDADGGAITYSSSKTDVAEVSASGELTIKNVGSTTITATAAAVSGKYAETSITYVLYVSEKSIIVTIGDKDRQFGEENPTFTYEEVTLVNENDDLNIELSTVATISSNVGEYYITGTYSNSNYTVTFVDGTLEITKADEPTLDDIVKNALYSKSNTITISVTGLPQDCGDYLVVLGEATGDDIIDSINETTIVTKIGGEVSETATIPVTITMQNYANATLDVIVTLVDKTEVTITGIELSDKEYDGTALAYTGTAIGDNDYEGEFEYTWNVVSANVGEYTLTVSIPESDETFMGSETFTANITQKDLIITPTSQTINNGNALPTEFTLTYTGLVTGDEILMTGDAVYKLTDSTDTEIIDSNTNGTYNIVLSGVTFENDNYNISTDVGTLTIKTKSNTNTNTGGSTGGTIIVEPESNVTDGDDGSVTVSPETSTTGTTTKATLSDDDVTTAIDNAIETSEDGTIAIEISVDVKSTTTAMEVEITSDSMSAIADSNSSTLTITSDVGTLVLSDEATASIASQANGDDITIIVEQVDTTQSLNAIQQSVIGDNPVYDLSILVNGKNITEFDGGLITVYLPYELKDGENPSGVVVWYVDELGNIEKMYAMYDVASECAIFTTSHFSYFYVEYEVLETVEHNFTDVDEQAYYYYPMLWAVLFDITKGVSETEFGPDLGATRAQVMTLIYKTMGSPEISAQNTFIDVEADDYYYDAVLWAVDQGITKGKTDTTFDPEAVCTRAEIVTFLYRLASEPEVEGENSFVDVSANSYYYNAVLWAVDQGITLGTSDNKFSPDKDCTRGEIVTFLYRNFNK